MKAKYKAQVDHLRGQLASVEQSNAQLSSQVAALTEQLSKLRCGTEGSKVVNGGKEIVIKQERRDSYEADAPLDGNACTASGRVSQVASGSEKGSDATVPRPVASS